MKCKDHPHQNPYVKDQPKCYPCLWNAKHADLRLDSWAFEFKVLFGQEHKDVEAYRERMIKYWEKKNK